MLGLVGVHVRFGFRFDQGLFTLPVRKTAVLMGFVFHRFGQVAGAELDKTLRSDDIMQMVSPGCPAPGHEQLVSVFIADDGGAGIQRGSLRGHVD